MKYIYALLISLLLPTAVFAQSVPVSWLRNVASGFLTPLNINDKVGIGTTSPYRTLSVSGDAVFTGGNVLASSFTATSTISTPSITLSSFAVNTLLSTNASGVITATTTPTFGNFNATSTTATSTISTGGFAVGTSQFVVQQNSGNVGVGVVNPGRKVEINDSTAPYLRLSNSGYTTSLGLEFYRNASDFGSITYAPGGGAVSGLILRESRSGTDGNIHFQTNGANTRMTINGLGYVGIGTTTPQTLLEVTSSTGNPSTLRLSRAGASSENDSIGNLQFVESRYGGGILGQIDTVRMGGNQYNGSMTFSTGKNSVLSEKMRITNSGNVGIGTTTPWTKLAVTGSTTIAGGPLIVFGAANTPISADTDLYRQFGLFRKDINDYTFTTFENRNGGSNASVDLLWNNDRTTALSYYADLGFNSSAFNNPAFGNLNVANAWYGYNTDGPILWATATTSTAGYFDVTTGGYSSSRFRITSTGNIGIGTTTPVANLQVTNSTSNATTTVEFGRSGQNKGSCIKLYDEVGTAYYLKVATGGTLNLSATACATVTGF